MKSGAIIFDLDGTALPIGDVWGVPSERLKQAIHALKDRYYICAATGRSMYYAKHILEFLDFDDPCIVAAGTEIYDPKSKQIVWRESIPTATYEHIKQTLKDNHNEAFGGDGYEEGITGASVEKLLHDDVAVIYVLAVEPLEAAALETALQHPDLHIINMHSYDDGAKRDLHIHSAKASKEHAVDALLQRLQVAKAAATVIGDGLNDLHLFVAGGTKIAMGNAVPELKAAADHVIDSVDNDGLAAYLESLAG